MPQGRESRLGGFGGVLRVAWQGGGQVGGPYRTREMLGAGLAVRVEPILPAILEGFSNDKFCRAHHFASTLLSAEICPGVRQ